MATRAGQISSIVGSVSGNWLVTRLRRPLDAADIVEDTAVWREEPHEKLGEVDRVLLDDQGRITALVMKRGFCSSTTSSYRRATSSSCWTMLYASTSRTPKSTSSSVTARLLSSVRPLLQSIRG